MNLAFLYVQLKYLQFTCFFSRLKRDTYLEQVDINAEITKTIQQ
jgi:hypothetical protein